MKKFLVVVLWVAASGAVAGIISWIASLPIDSQDVTTVAIVGLVNALLAGLLKWLNTKK